MTFFYNDTKHLVCECSSFAHYGSIYISKELCPGHRCVDPEHPVLDYEDGQCVCKSHPCWHDNGRRHTCADKAEFPILKMRYHEARLTLLLEILDDLYGCMVCILFVLFSLEFLQCYDVLCFFFLFSDTFECRSTGACTECVNVAFRWRRIKHFLYLTMTSLVLILMKQILKMILRNSDRSAIAVWITASPFLTRDPRFREVGNPPAVSRTAPLQRSAVKSQRVFCLGQLQGASIVPQPQLCHQKANGKP